MSLNVILTNDGEIDGFSLLNEKGIKTFHYPMIKISALNSDVSFSLDEYDFFIFTSKNGVKFFFEKDTVKSQNKTSIKCISIGSKTNKALHEYNIEPIYSAMFVLILIEIHARMHTYASTFLISSYAMLPFCVNRSV